MSEATALLFLAVLTSLSVQPKPAELRLNFLLPGSLGLGASSSGVSRGLYRGCSLGRVGGFLRSLIVASGHFSGMLIKAGV